MSKISWNFTKFFVDNPYSSWNMVANSKNTQYTIRIMQFFYWKFHVTFPDIVCCTCRCELDWTMSVFAARLTPGSSGWLALGDGRYGNELRQQQQHQQQPMAPTPSPRHMRSAAASAAFGETEWVKNTRTHARTHTLTCLLVFRARTSAIIRSFGSVRCGLVLRQLLYNSKSTSDRTVGVRALICPSIFFLRLFSKRIFLESEMAEVLFGRSGVISDVAQVSIEQSTARKSLFTAYWPHPFLMYTLTPPPAAGGRGHIERSLRRLWCDATAKNGTHTHTHTQLWTDNFSCALRSRSPASVHGLEF